MKKFQKVMALLLILTMICSAIPAREVNATESVTSSQKTSERSGYLRAEEAAQKIKQHMLDRNTENLTLKVYIEDERALGYFQLWQMFDELVYRHTGVPTEGDYLRYCTRGTDYVTIEHIREGNEHWITFYFNATYFQSYDREAAVTTKVKDILASLDLNGKSDYEKALAIYGYICKNVVYEENYEQLNDFSQEHHDIYSAYGAIINNKAVCEGYALAMYRLLLEAGIDNRVITSSLHAWNLAKIGDRYYNLDSTWDAGVQNPEDYSNFLRGSADFYHLHHSASAEFVEQDFLKQFPESPVNYGAPETATGSGTCGDNATWTLTVDGTLTISGTGDMDSTNEATLWTDVNMYVKKVVIQEGITSIGAGAFWNCPQLESISIPSSVTQIGAYAFDRCYRLKEAVIPNSVTEIGAAAFNACTSLEKVVLPEGLKVIRESTFNCCTALKGITLPNSVTTIEGGAFASAFDPEANVTLVVPETVTEVTGPWTFAWMGVKKVIWNAKTENLDDYVLYRCEYLEEVVLNDSIKRIGEEVFSHCHSLKKVNLPASLEELVDNTQGLFLYCYALESITIPEGITKIPANMFWDCFSLTQIELHDGITEIGKMAFGGTGITSIVIPASVKKIGFDAFAKLHLKITFQGDAPTVSGGEIGQGIFTGIVEAYYPYGNPTWTEEARNALAGEYREVTWRTKHPAGAAHMPRENAQWLHDENGHWHECLGCDEKIEYEEHNLSEYSLDGDRWMRFCWICGITIYYENGPEQECQHSYDNACDTDCNICGEQRSVPDHLYDSDCDATCNYCGYSRTVTHNYQWYWDAENHWKVCSCGDAAVVGQKHTWSNGVCTECGLAQEVAPTEPEPTEPEPTEPEPTEPEPTEPEPTEPEPTEPEPTEPEPTEPEPTEPEPTEPEPTEPEPTEPEPTEPEPTEPEPTEPEPTEPETTKPIACDHSFDNNCDDCCNDCGYVRVPKHNASWEIDANEHKIECPDCGYATHADHGFDDNGVCVECGYDRNDTSKPEKPNYTVLWFGLGIVAVVAVAVLFKKRKNK